MNCPHCTIYDIKTRGYKPTRMHYERILVGGGSAINRHDGTANDTFTDTYRCYQCGEVKIITPEPIPYSELLERENQKIKAQLEQEKIEQQQVVKNERKLSEKMADLILGKFQNSVEQLVAAGTDWKNITKLLSTATGRQLTISTLQRVWEERYAA